MGITDADNEQDKMLAKHETEIEGIKGDLSWMKPTIGELTKSTVAQGEHIKAQGEQVRALFTASEKQLEAVQCNTTAISKTQTDVRWIRTVGWTLATILLGAAGYFLRHILEAG